MGAFRACSISLASQQFQWRIVKLSPITMYRPLYARHARASAFIPKCNDRRYWHSNSGCPSVCLSGTLWYCVKTAKGIV